jgi:hypothetical protein
MRRTALFCCKRPPSVGGRITLSDRQVPDASARIDQLRSFIDLVGLPFHLFCTAIDDITLGHLRCGRAPLP